MAHIIQLRGGTSTLAILNLTQIKLGYIATKRQAYINWKAL